jgi:hypothetical protein|nr:MAG TPA: hypothetical protein [Caudoviricetes sp.]
MFYDFYYYDAPPDGDVWNTDNGTLLARNIWIETSAGVREILRVLRGYGIDIATDDVRLSIDTPRIEICEKKSGQPLGVLVMI